MSTRTGFRIRSIRRQMGWTRKKLAELWGTSVYFVTLVEKGRREPGEDRIEQLRDAIGMQQLIV